MTDGRWERLEQLFHAAIPLAPKDRQDFLARETGGDAAFRADVERLLAAHDRSAGFIQKPAVALPGPWEPPAELPIAGRRIGAYRLARELGRGGMGAVYLAERDDGAFSQRVAIKLIKRGMDTDQVLARFRAERQILASLDHPNIARLLDGGTTDEGLPYFTMEYIDGQPVDAFADAGRLRVEERLRLFLQVCDAVSYAHERGVIHRDIKPVNILVTPSGVPKLLDFGIAKVLQENPDEITSTVTGLRLLTPEYASPEQVEGRHAAAASDVYSLGVVLYELLTGRSPYRLTSRAPQDIAAAVCTTEPDRPSTVVTRPAGSSGRPRCSGAAVGSPAPDPVTARQLSRRLRGDLDTIVLTAIRKEPARRYSSVASLADDLRRHLDERPVIARADGVGYRMRKFVRRNRAGVLAGAVAIVGAAALAAAGLSLARSADRDDTSLLATRALAPRARILVADFADRTGDTTLTATVTEAFRIDLAQSPVVRVMTARQLRASLERMEHSADVALNDSLAREVALREDVAAFVTGSLAKLSGAYTVTVQLVGARDGEALAAVRETAVDSSELIPAVDRASKTLRRRIGESLRDLKRMPKLEQVTTASLPALRLYTEAQRLVRRGDRTAAIDRFQAAVALDTGFASAHIGLSMAYGSIGDLGRTFAAGEHALANQERLPYLERAFLMGSKAHGSEDYRSAIEAYTSVLERYPDNVPALNNLALAYRNSRQFSRAESLFRQATRTDSTIANLYFGLHSSQVLGGDFPGARATLDTIARRFPDHPVRLTEEMQDAAARQDWSGTERIARATIAQKGTDTLQLVDPYEALAGSAMTQGRLGEAERLWRRQLALSRAAGVMGRYFFGVLQLATLELRYRNDEAQSLALVDSAMKVTPLDSLLPGDRRYDELARFYIAAGEPARVRPLLQAAAANDSLIGRRSEAERSWTLGALALAEGRSAEAIRQLRRAADTHLCTICVLPDLGRAYEAAGQPAAARQIYERYLATPWLWRYEPDAAELGWTMKRLAELDEVAGDRSAAARVYSELLQLWSRADPELRGTVDAVRERLGALGGEG
ncbi:MAG TPA: protein kinase [Gemmatimonadales bacterium]|nr:protein kinase [Gemmatimonadales bacterium]